MFKGYSFAKEIILCCVYRYLRYSLSYRDVVELISERGVLVHHTTVWRWVLKFTPLLEKAFNRKKKVVGTSWRMDETYIKVKGDLFYLYRAVDKEGNTIDFLLSKTRDTEAARSFFRKAIINNGVPHIINIDKSGANKAGIEATNKVIRFDKRIEIRQVKYLNNIVEQDHRFIKRLTRPMLGFKDFASAAITLAEIEIVRMIKKGQLRTFGENKTAIQQFCSLCA